MEPVFREKCAGFHVEHPVCCNATNGMAVRQSRPLPATSMISLARYVALLERNQRPMTADLLLRLARGYKLDVADIAAEDSEAWARRLGDSG